MRIGISSGTGFGGTLNYDLDKDGCNDKEAEILEAEGVDVILDIDGKSGTKLKRMKTKARSTIRLFIRSKRR